jgi:hypothetical protein
VLTNKLRRLEPSLRAVGVDLRESRVGRGRTRIITLEKLDETSSVPSTSSTAIQTGNLTEDDGAGDFNDNSSSAPNFQKLQADTAPADADDPMLGLSSAPPADCDVVELTERAAILEFDGSLVRDEAERLAR